MSLFVPRQANKYFFKATTLYSGGIRSHDPLLSRYVETMYTYLGTTRPRHPGAANECQVQLDFTGKGHEHYFKISFILGS
jgi:hypothetical protein